MSAQPGWVVRLDTAPQTLALAEHELEAVCGARPRRLALGLYGVEHAPPAHRAAYALSTDRLLEFAEPGVRLTARPELDSIRVVRRPWTKSSPLALLGDVGWPARAARADEDPRATLYPTPEGWFLTDAVPHPWEDVELPWRTSSSLPSRLSRACVNLIAGPGDVVLDPICGAGTLLVEAARIGCRVRGGDLKTKACWMTRTNLRSVGFEGLVKAGDALERAPNSADALVADVPYGRRLAPQNLHPLLAHLPRLAPRWAIVAHLDLRHLLSELGHAPRLVVPVPKNTFTRWIHVGGSPRPRVGGNGPGA